MRTRPQVRIWGIVDLFLLLAVVLMIARVDAVAEAESESDAVARLEKEKKELLTSLGEANAKNQRLSKSLMDSQAAESKAEADRIKAERASEKASEHQKELERQLENFKAAADQNFKSEADIERYRRLKGMVDIIELTLEDTSLVAIDDKTFLPTRFNLVKTENDPEFGPSGKLNRELLEEAMLNLRQHISSKARNRVLIMLGYRGSNSSVLRESFRQAALEMATAMLESGTSPEISLSQWFKRD